VECIVPGKPEDKYPWFYIDPETCIDCSACIPECPYDAIFPLKELPSAYRARGGEILSQPVGTPGFTEAIDVKDYDGRPVHIPATRKLKAGEIVDFTPDVKVNENYYKLGPGYETAL
jgi:ferredoxin